MVGGGPEGPPCGSQSRPPSEAPDMSSGPGASLGRGMAASKMAIDMGAKCRISGGPERPRGNGRPVRFGGKTPRSAAGPLSGPEMTLSGGLAAGKFVSYALRGGKIGDVDQRAAREDGGEISRARGYPCQCARAKSRVAAHGSQSRPAQQNLTSDAQRARRRVGFGPHASNLPAPWRSGLRLEAAKKRTAHRTRQGLRRCTGLLAPSRPISRCAP